MIVINIKLMAKTALLASAVFSAPLLAENDKAEKHFARCVACHLAEGQGIPGAFPPLKNRLAKLTGSELGRQYLVQVVYTGLMGVISVGDQSYSGFMPGQANDLTPKEVSDMLNYAVNEVDKDSKPDNWKPFSEDEIVRLSKVKSTSISNRDLRKQLLESQPELK